MGSRTTKVGHPAWNTRRRTPSYCSRANTNVGRSRSTCQPDPTVRKDCVQLPVQAAWGEAEAEERPWFTVPHHGEGWEQFSQRARDVLPAAAVLDRPRGRDEVVARSAPEAVAFGASQAERVHGRVFQKQAGGRRPVVSVLSAAWRPSGSRGAGRTHEAQGLAQERAASPRVAATRLGAGALGAGSRGMRGAAGRRRRLRRFSVDVPGSARWRRDDRVCRPGLAPRRHRNRTAARRLQVVVAERRQP